MTTIEQQLRKYEGLIRHTTHKLLAKHRNSRRRDGFDDYLSEARIAAWRAIKAFDEARHVRVETFIICAVRNHLATVDRALNSKMRTPFAEAEFLEAIESGGHDRRFAALAEIKDALCENDYQLVRQLAMGHGITELAEARGVRREEVIQCLHRIQHKLQSLGLSPQPV